MKATPSLVSAFERFNILLRAQPIILSLAFFLIVIALRALDAFVLRLDELPDPYIFSKALGFTLVLGYLYLLRKPLDSVGLHARNFDKAFLVGMLSLLILYATLYTVQFHRLSLAGETPRLVFAAIDRGTGTMGGLYFTSFHLVGQLFNAFMEESIFRGMILPHLMLRLRFWQANVLQAFLFGLAHLVFPLSSWAGGQATAGEAVAEAWFLLLATTFGGIVFGYLYYRTDSLWTAIFAHLIDNTTGLFLHIRIVERLDAEADISILARIGFLALTILAWAVARRANLPSLRPRLDKTTGV